MTVQGAGGAGDGRRQAIGAPGVPPSIGPYSPAVRAGDLLFVSGMPGIDPVTGALAGETFAAQARQAFVNLADVLVAGGSRPDLVVNTTVLMADFADFATLNELYADFFPNEPPARMTMQVPFPGGVLISMGAVALVADQA